MNLIEQLNWRYATKVFDPTKKVSDDDLNTLKEVLRLSPSSYGLQFWRFALVNNPTTRAELREHSWNQGQVVDASHLFVLCRLQDFVEADIDQYIDSIALARGVDKSSLEAYGGMMKNLLEMPLEKKHAWMEKQVYIALGFLMEACAVMGIDACPMEGFEAEAYNKILKLPEKNLHATVVCPVGYRSEEDKYATLAKVRYPLNDLIVEI